MTNRQRSVISFGRERRKQSKGEAFRLKKAKTSKNAVFATGAEGGSRSADCPSK